MKSGGRGWARSGLFVQSDLEMGSGKEDGTSECGVRGLRGRRAGGAGAGVGRIGAGWAVSIQLPLPF